MQGTVQLRPPARVSVTLLETAVAELVTRDYLLLD
jgi:hypothetical protein